MVRSPRLTASGPTDTPRAKSDNRPKYSRLVWKGFGTVRWSLGRLGTLLCLVAWLVPGAAQAELGGSAAGVPAEASRMKATVASVAMGNYTRHELTRPNGGMVREFANADGQVFAVIWAGPGKPDLRSLLGPYFTTLQPSGNATGRMMHGLRRPSQVAQPDLRIQTAGHMGWFRGVAFLPALAPAGFSTNALSPQP